MKTVEIVRRGDIWVAKCGKKSAAALTAKDAIELLHSIERAVRVTQPKGASEIELEATNGRTEG